MPPFVSNYQRYIAVYGGEDSEKKATGLMMGNLTLPEGYMVHYEPSGSSRIIREPDRDLEAWAKFRARKISDPSVGGPAYEGNTTLHLQPPPRYQEFAYFDAQGRLSHAALEPAGVIGSSRVAEAYARPKKALPRRLDGARFCRLNFEKSSHEVNAHLRGDPQQRRLSRVTHPLPGCLV
ncbi:hypothetical protein FOZ63_031227 [Perkinsus olseni]|uniref:Uncharacterized protein n=1 Tax=Perkinsus olseni TaxID=32597 RepID=A0A7J6UKF2_PEROL|nr:hypothetical protein FOZ63_031227 [Perkinsus olseni]